ncbi:MAG: EF-hand domain-containing protein [Rhodospirillaceae bacterium]|nr:EF-hand domain-containing protein [Rhodospirillaceae bacterium]
MAELDGDKDGTVSLREFLAAGRTQFLAADLNRDGRLSFAEFVRAAPR